MAAVTVASSKVRRRFSGEFEDILILPPSSMDSGDTMDVSGLAQGRSLVDASAWDVTSEDSVTCTVSSNVATLDSGGGTSNHQYAINLRFANIN